MRRKQFRKLQHGAGGKIKRMLPPVLMNRGGNRIKKFLPNGLQSSKSRHVIYGRYNQRGGFLPFALAPILAGALPVIAKGLLGGLVTGGAAMGVKKIFGG